MTGPRLIVEFPIEGAPRVLIDAVNESEQERLLDWIKSSNELLWLVADAIELQRKRAA